jgi:protein-S-isoprenylcysteine O-methyltransferase Ste14
MARPAFKRWWTRIVPAQVERSTYVLLASLILLLMFWQWRPIPGVVWDARSTTLGAVLLGLFGIGWLVVLLSTFMINHFDLFGLRQVTLYFQRRPYTSVSFVKRGLYRVVRHPIMLGFVIAFWATPMMTHGHLLFAVVTTAYILVAIRFEEHDLAEAHQLEYEQYRRETSMIIPLPLRIVRNSQQDSQHQSAEVPSETWRRLVGPRSSWASGGFQSSSAARVVVPADLPCTPQFRGFVPYPGRARQTRVVPRMLSRLTRVGTTRSIPWSTTEPPGVFRRLG